jgi:hypothetical protein
MPESKRNTSIRFRTLYDDILIFSNKHHCEFRSIEIEVKKTVAAFGETPVDKIEPATSMPSSPASRTHRRPQIATALFSLIFREAFRNGKVATMTR